MFQYLSQNYLCRQASTDCDVPEFCTGQSEQVKAHLMYN